MVAWNVVLWCRTVAKPQSAKAAPKAKKCYWSSAVTRATKEPAPLDEATLAALRASVPPPPAPTEQFQHTPIPADMLEEAKAFREEVEKAEYEEDQIAMVDLVQTIATQVGLLQRAAEFLKKDVRDVTALDAATYRLHEHEEFVSKVQLDKVVLFSHENTLNNFRAGVKAISARYDNNKLPEGLQARLNEVDAVLAARVEEQEIIELKVSEEIYQSVQENLFPSFVKKVRYPGLLPSKQRHTRNADNFSRVHIQTHFFASETWRLFSWSQSLMTLVIMFYPSYSKWRSSETPLF